MAGQCLRQLCRLTGKYKASAGATACDYCETCPTGQVRNGCEEPSPGVCEFSSACEFCPPGQNRVGCVPGVAGSCEACVAGKYKTTTGTAACDPCPACPPGSYRIDCGGSSEGTRAGCGVCVAVEYRIECVALSPGRCTTCLPGTCKTSSGSEPCLTCGPGCEVGKYQSGCSSISGTPQCADCSAGKYTVSTTLHKLPHGKDQRTWQHLGKGLQSGSLRSRQLLCSCFDHLCTNCVATHAAAGCVSAHDQSVLQHREVGPLQKVNRNCSWGVCC